ncbi:glycosyltransferase family 4 protein [Corynebacterium sp. L4756]|uniref:glycosyltransferase family 4 protein n=1 Tax=unclassified Corynebacterium TaxID=2624378 RepID=UPI00374CDB63
MRIAIVTEVFLPKIDGVVTRLTRSLDQLAEMGHEVLIFAPGNPPASYAGFEVFKLPSMSFPVYPEIKFGLPPIRFWKKIRDFDPDVIHSVNPIWTAALGVFAAKRDAYPLVCSYHTNVPDYVEALGIGWTRGMATGAIRYLHNQAQVNLCTSDPMIEKAEQMGIERVQLWPKAVDTVGYHPAKATPAARALLTNNRPDAPLVTYIGRISREKDLERLNNVMGIVRTHVPGARLGIVGGGPYLETLQNSFDDSFTTFTGYLSGDELAAAFASGDVFVFPSATETLGLVALESFASGVPVIGTNAGGIPFVIDEGKTGHLIAENGSDEDWAQAIVGLLQDPQRRAQMGDAARGEAERYSWRESTEALVAAYEKAIG